MHLQKIHIDFYKNFSSITVDFAKKMNCIVGRNGVGKTNLLDAIYYLSLCKSNFVVTDAQCIKLGEDFFSLRAEIDKSDVVISIASSYDSLSKKKIVKCNGKKYNRLSDHIGLIPIVFITPSDISIINNSSVERRRFIDVFISQFNNEYLHALLQYNKLLMQRNKLLKEAKNSVDYDLFSVIDMQLAKYATLVFNVRKQTIKSLQPIVSKYYTIISDYDSIEMEYDSKLNNGDILSLLERNFKRDVMLQHTSAGVHRDDLIFSMNNMPLKQVGSQGQKKSFLLALRFAQYEMLNDIRKIKPILLLDDLFDKLDYERCTKIINIVQSETFGQIFISDTDKTYIDKMFKVGDNESKLFIVDEFGIK